MLVEGPVEIEDHEGEVVRSDRFVVAICGCGRSKTYPLCDTSHRRKRRQPESSRPRRVQQHRSGPEVGEQHR